MWYYHIYLLPHCGSGSVALESEIFFSEPHGRKSEEIKTRRWSPDKNEPSVYFWLFEEKKQFASETRRDEKPTAPPPKACMVNSYGVL